MILRPCFFSVLIRLVTIGEEHLGIQRKKIRLILYVSIQHKLVFQIMIYIFITVLHLRSVIARLQGKYFICSVSCKRKKVRIVQNFLRHFFTTFWSLRMAFLFQNYEVFVWL